MIGLSKLTKDISNGALIINENRRNSDIYTATARVSRAQTLDGGVVIDHQGFVAGDRTIVIEAELSESDEAILRDMFENETLIYLSTADGFYSGAIERMAAKSGLVTFSVLLKAVS